ncbi:MAG: hypothetical protein EOO06_05265 [Chitinophagaceae bacterium]|nr:MAG: hypothetical protein EOO06_05265 [Chitinophagaceae bacterium]
MYPYFDNQPFLDSLSSQTATINSLQRDKQHLAIILCAVVVVGTVVGIKLQQYKNENDQLRRGFRLP